jgi:glycosyltransferase involved in cell wall biosynthesis
VALRMARTNPTLSELPPPPPGRTGWPWTTETSPPPESGDWPELTVVTPSFGQSAFLEATIRSVLLQAYPRLQYLVLDGGSIDGSVEIIARYAPWLSGWASERDRGQSDAINKGFSQATGRVVAWLNSDDRYLPGTLHSVARQVQAHPGAAAWIGACRSVDARGRALYLIEPRGLELPTLADWCGEAWFAQPASFYDRAAAGRAGPLDERLASSFDVDFFLRLARQGPFVGTREVWAEETIHPAAKTSARPGRSRAELHLVQFRNGYEQVALRQIERDVDELVAFRRAAKLPKGPVARLRAAIGAAWDRLRE